MMPRITTLNNRNRFTLWKATAVVVVCLLASLNVQAQTIHTVCTSGCDFLSIQGAINAAEVDAGDVIELTENMGEGLITINKSVIIDGGGYTLTSLSVSYGFEVEEAMVSIVNLKITGAGTFAIHSVDGANNLTLTQVSAINNGRTGIALNCTSDLVLTDIISTGNGGNGISLTNCQNVTITNITTSGNAFSPGGFGSGVGIFNTTEFCPSEISSGIVIEGVVKISEKPAYYEQASSAGASVPNDTELNPGAGSTTFANTHQVQFAGGGGTFGFPSLLEALTFAADAIAVNENPAGLRSITSVREIATGNLIVQDAIQTSETPTETLSIQAAINAASEMSPTTIRITGDYGEDVNTDGKPITIEVTSGN